MPVTRHRYTCRDKDCESPLCEAFREGYDAGYADGFPDGVAACPLPHQG